MNSIGNTIRGIIQVAQTSNNITEGDYLGEEGLYYCGKCNTRKQTVVNFLGEDRLVPCICTCRQAELEAEKEAEKQREQFNKIMRLRNTGFLKRQCVNGLLKTMTEAIQN